MAARRVSKLDPEKPLCERTMCIRACQILSDKMCIDMMERHNKTSPPLL